MADDIAKASAMRQAYVEQAFTMPADRNYLIARIAFNRDLIFDGYWAAAQATEKYLKAALLLNGFDAKYGHNLLDIFETLKSKVPLTVIPEEFMIPKGANPDQKSVINWGNNSITHFVNLLDVYGSADNRYGRNGYHFDFYVLPKLDQLIYILRRNCQTLSVDNPIRKDSANWKLGPTMLLETHIEKKEWASDSDNQLVDDFLTGNIVWQSIIAGGGVQVPLQPMMAWQQTAYGAAVQSVDASPQDLIDFNKWLLSNVRLNKPDAASVNEEIRRLEVEIGSKTSML